LATLFSRPPKIRFVAPSKIQKEANVRTSDLATSSVDLTQENHVKFYESIKVGYAALSV